MKRANVYGALVALGIFTLPAVAGIDYIYEDSPYLSGGDSPFDLSGPGSDFLLQDFEPGTITPGLLALFGEVRGPSSHTDSVDADDGLIDGFGQDGHSFWTFFGEGGPIARFEFDAEVLGGLPQQVGLVWTDGNVDAITYFEAFDYKGQSLGILELQLGDDNHTGGTAEDRFVGISFEGGISAFEVRATLGRIELDHVQYGNIIPAPGVLALLGLSGLFGVRSRRRLI